MKPSSTLIFYLFVLFAASLLCANKAFGQEKCGTVPYNKSLYGENYEENTNRFEAWIKAKKDKYAINSLRTKADVVYKVPVVVHVIHNGEALGEGSNIPFEQIADQIKILNKDYRRENSDTISTPDMFKPVAADIGIEFVLAKQDPNGLPTNGVVRVKGGKTSWVLGSGTSDDEASLKAESYWPAEDYLNIWVAPLDNDLIGYAQFPESDLPGLTPSAKNRLRDGVVVDYEYFGSIGNAIPSSLGRTTTHEIGHFFGLRHIWGDASSSVSNSNCDVDDYCEDTPNCNGPTNGSNTCPVDKQTCGSIDMIQNYMDYTNDICMNLFTQDQKLRMVTVIENSPRRTSLTTSPGLEEPIVAANDIGIRAIMSPQSNECSGLINPAVLLVNTGEETLTSYKVKLFLQGNLVFEASGNKALATGDSTTLTFPPISLNNESNTYELSFEVSEVNGMVDENIANNLEAISLYIPQTAAVPFYDDFQDASTSLLLTGGLINNPDGNITWALTDAPGNGENNQALFLNFFDYETGIGENDVLYSPTLDLSDASDATLLFKVAHAPFTDVGEDRLLVGISTDCGNSIQTFVYNKAGKALSTTDAINNAFVPSNRSQWRQEEISLKNFVGSPNVQIAFIGQNGYGNNVYLDDVEIKATIKADLDLSIERISSPALLSCDTDFTPELVVKNQGSNLVSTFTITYLVDEGTENTFTYSEAPILAGEEILVRLNPMSLNIGAHLLEISVENPNSIADQQPADNTETLNFIIDNQQDVIPLLQAFLGTSVTDPSPSQTAANESRWQVVNPDGDITWELTDAAGNGTENQAAVLRHYDYNKTGPVDQLLSPTLDFSQTREASLFFKVSYAFYDKEYVDTLRVKVSTNCGVTYQTVYEKAGQELAVVESSESWVPSTPGDWIEEFIDLTEFAGQENLRVAFETVNGYGNNMYLDDIEFFVSDNPDPIKVKDGNFVIYPVPTQDELNVTFDLLEKENTIIQFYDIRGRLLMNQTYPNTLNQTYQFDVRTKPAGVYVMRIMSNTINTTRRIIVR